MKHGVQITGTVCPSLLLHTNLSLMSRQALFLLQNVTQLLHLVAGLRPYPLRELTVLPRPPSLIKGEGGTNVNGEGGT